MLDLCLGQANLVALDEGNAIAPHHPKEKEIRQKPMFFNWNCLQTLPNAKRPHSNESGLLINSEIKYESGSRQRFYPRPKLIPVYLI